MFTLIWGAISGFARTILDDYNREDELQNMLSERDWAKVQYEDQIALMNLKFEEAKEEANKTADSYDRKAEQLDKEANIKDKQTTLDEQYVSNSFNNQFKQLQAEQIGNAFEWNQQAMAIGQNEGNELSRAAASGTRAGGSMSQATELQTDILNKEFQNAQNLTRLNNELKTYNLFNTLNKNVNDIQGSRYDADFMRDNAGFYRADALDLRNSYLEGGIKYNIFQQEKKNAKDRFEAAIDDLNKDINTIQDNGYRIRRGLSNFFGGFNEGLRTGREWENVFQNAWGNNS